MVLDQAESGDSRWVHAGSVRLFASTVGFGGPPTAGRQRVFSWVASLLVVKSHLGSPWSSTAGAQGTVAVCRASVFLSGVLTEAGVKPAVHLRGPAPLAASPTQPVGGLVGACRTRSIQGTW